MARRQRAAERRAEQWAECRRRHEEEDRRQRVMVITEFDAGDPEATMRALADEILKYPPGCAAACEGDRLDRRWRAVRADRSRPLLASEAYH